MNHTTDLIIFGAVIAIRLSLPLFIPRYPLPAIVACLVVDAVDQTVFQTLTDLGLHNYQSYDKALDIYYLTIAYLSTLRNWASITAVEIAQFLIYYRLVGVVLFEQFERRWLLFVFANTFEYFFIFYEVVRLRWNPLRMSRSLLIGASTAIWLVIKVPQEYWLHIAKRDVTDTLRANPRPSLFLAVALAGIVSLAWLVTRRMVPPADYRFNAVAQADEAAAHTFAALNRELLTGWRRFVNPPVIEKVALLSLLLSIFGQILPESDISKARITLSVIILVLANAFVSEALRRRGIIRWRDALAHFRIVAGINLVIGVAGYYLLPSFGDDLLLINTLFYLILISMIVTLYDRFHPVYEARRYEAGLPLGSTLEALPLTTPAP